MASYQIGRTRVIGTGERGTQLPNIRWIDTTAAAGAILQRAIILFESQMRQVTAAQEGTGLAPLVLVSGAIQQRVASEGEPLIWDGATLRTLDATTEELVI